VISYYSYDSFESLLWGQLLWLSEGLPVFSPIRLLTTYRIVAEARYSWIFGAIHTASAGW
jgi:hypothetical protein